MTPTIAEIERTCTRVTPRAFRSAECSGSLLSALNHRSYSIWAELSDPGRAIVYVIDPQKKVHSFRRG